MPSKIKIKILFLLLVGAFLSTTGFRCSFIKSKQEKQALTPVNLSYWRVWEGRDELSEILSTYKTLHPNISINVKTLRFEEFEQELLESYSKNKVPDIISLHSSWMKKYHGRGALSSMPPEVVMAYQFQQKTLGIKKEVITELRTTKTPTVGQIKQKFIDVVAKDVIIDNQVYGLPLAVDTMVLYYNRDLLNNAGFALPPSDWTEFQQQVQATTFFDVNRDIAVSGVGLGTADNIRRSTDILTLLMMQNGSEIINDSGSVAFHTIPSSFSDRSYHPGIEALQFYLDFADPTKEVYTWNEQQEDALTAFARNNAAFYLGYSYDLAEILALSKGNINLGITEMPQVDQTRPSNSANYWVETVSNNTKHKNEAWDFVIFATNEKSVSTFLKKAQRPTALRALIATQQEDDIMRVFANQLLTSQSWYRGNDSNTAEEIIKQMIRSVSQGEKIEKAMNFAAQRVQHTINQQP